MIVVDVTPLFKKKNPSQAKNWRHVSVLPIVSKKSLRKPYTDRQLLMLVCSSHINIGSIKKILEISNFFYLV